MIDEHEPDTGPAASGPDWCRQIGAATLDGFLAYAAGKATEALTLTDLRGLAQRFNADPEIMAERYRALWAQGGWTRRGDETPDRRSAPLQRLLVEGFEHLLAPAGSSLDTLADGSPAIPRAAIAGVLSALATMAPGNLWDQARRRCVDIVAGLRQRHGASFQWTQVEQDPEIRRLVDDVRMAVLPYFTDYDKRRRWFLAVVDRHQPDLDRPDVDGRPMTHQTLLDEPRFDRMFAALLDDLFRRLKDPASRADLAGRYGAQSLEDLAELLGHLPTPDRAPAFADA